MAVRIRFRKYYECDTEAERSLDWGADSLIYTLDTNKYYKIYAGGYVEVPLDEVIFNSPIPISKVAISGVADGSRFLRDDGSWANPPGGGADNFTELLDVPSSYTTHSLKGVRVNAGETGLEFYTIPAMYTDEQAQDAVGAMVSSEFTYTDSTPLLAINQIDWSKIVSTPTTLAGYGITDAAPITGSTAYWRAADGVTLTGNNTITMGANTITFTGNRVTFTPDATNAGLNVGSIAGTVSGSPANGDIYYNSTANHFIGRQTGSSKPFMQYNISTITGNRIPYAGNSTGFTDSANLTFNGTGMLIGGGTITASTSLDVRGVNGGNIITFRENTGATSRYTLTDAGSHSFAGVDFIVSTTEMSFNVTGGNNVFDVTTNGGGFLFAAGSHATPVGNKTFQISRTLTATGTTVHNYLDLTGTINGTSTGQLTYVNAVPTFTDWDGAVTGYDWNPTTPANIAGTHIAYRATSGAYLHGSALPTSPAVAYNFFVSSNTTQVASSYQNSNAGTAAIVASSWANDANRQGILRMYSSVHSTLPQQFWVTTSANDTPLVLGTNGASARITIAGTGPITFSDVTGNVGTWITFSQGARTSGVPGGIVFNGGAHNGISNSETLDVNFNLARTVTYAGSATEGAANIATQRAFSITSPTYAFGSTGAQTITDAIGLYLTAPTAGTNATFTRRWGLAVVSGDVWAGARLVVGATSFSNSFSDANRIFEVKLATDGVQTASMGYFRVINESDGLGLRLGTGRIDGYLQLSGDNLVGNAAHLVLYSRNITSNRRFLLRGGTELLDVDSSTNYNSEIVGTSMASINTVNTEGGSILIYGGAKATAGTNHGNVYLAHTGSTARGTVGIGTNSVTTTNRLEVWGVNGGNIWVGKDSTGTERLTFTDTGLTTIKTELGTTFRIQNAANTAALAFVTNSSNPSITQTGGNSFDISHSVGPRLMVGAVPYFVAVSGGYTTVESSTTTAPTNAATQISSLVFSIKNMIWNGTDADSGFYSFQNVVSTSVNTESDLVLTYRTGANYYDHKPNTVVATLLKINKAGAVNIPVAPAAGSTADTFLMRDSSGEIQALTMTGTPDGTKFFRDDGSWQTVTAGYTNLTQFVSQTAWRLFYSDANGDVQELALGGAGTYLQSNGASSVPSWATPGGGGDMLLGTVQTVTAAKIFDAGTLKLNDTDSAFNLILGSTSTITTADKTLTFDVNDGNRTLTIGADTVLSGGTHSGTNTGDQTSIVGITGTKAQFDTAVTDGNFMYVGDAPTAHTHAWADITGEPTTLSGYGISDTKANFDAALSDGNFMYVGDPPTAHTHAWADITGEPTTLSGYGISDTKANFNSALSDGDFMFVGDAPTAHTLDSHSNVTITANSAGEILKWSGTAWINNTLAEAGIQATITPAALTKTDDTNVTLTLGGSPSTALLAAASITVGWTGNLAVTRGGTGVNSISALSVWVANSANTITQVTAAANQSVRINTGGTAWEAYTPVSNTAGTNELAKSNGTGLIGSGIFSTTDGDIALGTGLAGASRTITIAGSATNVALSIGTKGSGNISMSTGDGLGSFQVLSGTYATIHNTHTSANTVLPALLLRTETSGVVGVGIGTSLTFGTETTAGLTSGSVIDSVSTNIGSGTEAFDMVLKTMSGGAAATQRLRVKSTGQIQFHNYTASGSFAGTPVGYLQFDSSGNIITAAVPGGGTVTATGGSLTANSVVLGAGGTDTKIVAGITTNGVGQLVLGVNVTTLGSVKMFGNTSGDVTLQPTAAAGTATVQTLPATTGTLVNRVSTANGVSASNSDGALTFSLGAITPTTVNGLTFTALATGFSIAGGTTSKTLTMSNTLTFSGTDGSTLNVGTGGTLGTAAFTASTAYLSSSTSSTQDGYFTGIRLLETVGAAFYLRIVAGSDLTAARTLTLTTGDADRTLTINASTTLGGGTHSGTNTGDQTITLTSDVTGTGTGSFATTIAANVVTYAKMQQASAGFTIMAKATTGAGNYAELAAGADSILMRSGSGNLTFGTIVTNQIGASQVTYAKIQNVAANSFLANATGSPAAVAEVATNRIPLFASAITGTPGATTYLRGDGTWAASISDGDKGDITVSASGATWTIDGDISKAWTGDHTFQKNAAVVELGFFRNQVVVDNTQIVNLKFQGLSDTSAAAQYGALGIWVLDDVNTAHDGYMTFHVAFAGSLTERMRLLNTGQLRLPAYTASGSFSGTPVGYLQFDASGNIITAAVPSGGSIGGSITDNQIAVGAATSNNIEGTDNFTWDGAGLFVHNSPASNTIHRMRSNSGAGTTYVITEYENAGGVFFVGIDNSTGTGFGKGNYAANIYAPNVDIVMSSDGTERFRISGASSLVSSAHTIQAPNFRDSTAAYNVNLASNGTEGRGVVAGFSGSDYSGLGYNIRFGATNAQWVGVSTDTASLLQFTSGGFVFRGWAGGSAGRTLTGGDLVYILNSGALGLGVSTSHAFEVYRTSQQSLGIFRQGTSTNYSTIRLLNDTNNMSRSLEIDYSGSAYSGAILAGGISGEGGAITTTGNYPLHFGTNNTTRLYITGSGAVTAKSNFHITDVGTGQGIWADDGAGSTIFSIARQASNEVRFQGFGFITLYTGSSTGTEKVRVDGTGLGIGRTPVYKLDTSGRARIGYEGNTAGIWYEGSLATEWFAGLYDNSTFGWYYGAWRARMDSTGRLALGQDATSSTSVGLTVNLNTASQGSYIRAQNTNANELGIIFDRTGTGATTWYQYLKASNATDLYFYNGADRFSFATNGAFIASGDVTGYGTPSDESLKENITAIHNATDVLLALRPVTFIWKEGTKEREMVGLYRDHGFIAQDVQSVLPDLVRKNTNGLLSLRGQGIIPYLVKGFSEHEEEIDVLRRRVDGLEKQISLLQSQN